MSIIIKSLRVCECVAEYQVRVDRQSVLGNPFYMVDETKRDLVCDKYETYFTANCDGKLKNELDRLLQIYICYNKLELFCWCAPKRCHAETIKRYLENRIKNFNKGEN